MSTKKKKHKKYRKMLTTLSVDLFKCLPTGVYSSTYLMRMRDHDCMNCESKCRKRLSRIDTTKEGIDE